MRLHELKRITFYSKVLISNYSYMRGNSIFSFRAMQCGRFLNTVKYKYVNNNALNTRLIIYY